jgi:MFS transporter, DHA1 family, solute carrier family 18 (vesicular amine transporter), member 1/2
VFDALSRSRLLLLAAALVFVDTVFFSVLVPLLPRYVSNYDLTEAQAGLLSGGYALGTLVAALPAGILIWRIGPRRGVQLGLTFLALATVVFVAGSTIWVLDLARIAQGACGALVFSGGLTWVINGFPADRRGAAIGTVTGAGVLGALIGPLLGGVAASVGVVVALGGMVALIGLLGVATTRIPNSHAEEEAPPLEVVPLIRHSEILAGIALLLAPGVCFGVLGVVAPLRIDELGGGAGIIAAAYTTSAIVEGVLSPIAGRRSDRIGRRRPYLAGVGVCAVAVLGMAAAESLEAAVFALFVSAVGAGFCVAPGFAFLSDGALALSVHQAFAVSFANVAWSGGQALGGFGGGLLAWSSGFSVPLLAVFGLLSLAFIAGSWFLPRGPGGPMQSGEPA